MTEQQHLPQDPQQPAQHEAQHQPLPSVTVDVTALPEGDALAAYYAAYPAALAAFNEAKDRLEALKDGIKYELFQRAPEGTRDLEVRGPNGTPLRLDWRVSNRFDSRAFVKSSPANAALYEQFKRASGAWTLSAVKSGE